jgi:predicted RNA binding protein YcfA (HicA-like mRNA interferase family)
MNPQNLLKKALSGSRNLNIREILPTAEAFGFQQSRVSGSHHIFVHPGVEELVNLQDENGKAKPSQVWQLLKLVEQYNLTIEGGP